jgi:hypothetical protein
MSDPEQAGPRPPDDKWLDERRQETQGLLRLRKAQYSAALSTEHPPTAAELTVITRLENQLADQERISRVKELTRGATWAET